MTGNLGVAADLAGDGPSVLIDTDPQGSLSAWWNAREAESPALAPTTLAGLGDKLKALAEAGFTYAVVDTPPAITDAIRAVVALADFVLIPVKPSPHDLRAVGRTVEIAREGGKAFCFVLTQAKGNALLTVQAMAALSEHGVVVAGGDARPGRLRQLDDRRANRAGGRSQGAKRGGDGKLVAIR